MVIPHSPNHRRAAAWSLGAAVLAGAAFPLRALAQAPVTPAPATAQLPAELFQVGDTAPDALTLQQAVDYAMQHNPRIGGAVAQLRAARAVITQRRAARRPQANAVGSLYLQGPTVPSPIPGAGDIIPFHGYMLRTYASQIIYDFGQTLNRQRASERDAAAAGYQVAESRNNVQLVVATAYYNVLRGRELLRVGKEREATAAEHLRVSRARYQADVAPRFDVLRNEAELANAHTDVIAAQNDIDQANAAFNTALGRPVTSPVLIRFDLQPAPADVAFEVARAALLRFRPELGALRETVASSDYEIRARRAENKPQISLGGNIGIQDVSGFAGREYNWVLGLNMSFPFLDSGLTRGRVREARALRDVDVQALEQARQQAELDLRQAQADISNARQRVETSRTELTSAREALRVAQVRYRAGVGTNVEVTDAQAEVARAGEDLANAQFDLQTAEARLEFATGASAASLAAGAAQPLHGIPAEVRPAKARELRSVPADAVATPGANPTGAPARK